MCRIYKPSVQFVWEKRIGHLASENDKMTEFVNKSRKVDDRLQEERSEVDKDPEGYYDEYSNQ